MMVEMKDEAPENEITTEDITKKIQHNILQPENMYRHI